MVAARIFDLQLRVFQRPQYWSSGDKTAAKYLINTHQTIGAGRTFCDKVHTLLGLWMASGWLIGFKALCIALVADVFVFPILQSPPDVALIFRTCQLQTACEFLHENGGSERLAAWHGQLLHWQDRQQPEKYQTRRFIDTK